jgi:hypothetical protein
MNNLTNHEVETSMADDDFSNDLQEIDTKISDLKLEINKLEYEKKYISSKIVNKKSFIAELKKKREHMSIYTRNDLLNVLTLTTITAVILDIICDYTYQLEYVSYAANYSLNLDVWDAYCKTFVFKNFFIEYFDMTVYVIDISSNKLVNQYVISKTNHDIYLSFNTLPIYGFVRQHNKDNDKVYLVNSIGYILHFSITFNNSNNKCEIKEEKHREILFDRDSNIAYNDKSEIKDIKKLNSIIDFNIVGNEIANLLSDTKTDENIILFDNNTFNIDSNEHLSAIFYIGKNCIGQSKSPYLLEYNFVKKRVLNFYPIENNDDLINAEIHGKGKIYFDKSESNEEYMNIVYPWYVVVRLKKVVV